MQTNPLPSARAWRRWLAPLLLLLLLACLPSRAQQEAPVPIASLRELPLPKELRLAARPAPQLVLAPYEREGSGTLTDFQGQGPAFTPSGSWTLANGQARTGASAYQPNERAELVSEPYRLDTALTDRAYALMGFELYFDERYALETGHDFGSVYLQHERADQSWSAWTVVSQRTGQSPGTRLRTTHVSLRDPALWHKRVRVKFVLESDCAAQYEGWTLDNVVFRQIVTTPQIRLAFVTTPLAPIGPGTGGLPRVRPGDPLNPPINGLQRWLVPALERLQANPCRLDVTFVVNGSYIMYNSIVQDLPRLVNNNLDQLAELLQGARQSSCKRVRFVVAGGRQDPQPDGTPFNATVFGVVAKGSNDHATLAQLDLADLKERALAKVARNGDQNLVPPQNGALMLTNYLDTYYGATPEPGVKRVVVVLNNSDEFDNFDFIRGPVVTAPQLRAQLAAKGVTLLVNTHPELANRYGLGVLQQAATQNYQDRDPQHMLLDLAAAAACTDQDEPCCNEEDYCAQEEQGLLVAQAEIDTAPACPTPSPPSGYAVSTTARKTATVTPSGYTVSTTARQAATAAPGDDDNLLTGNPSGADAADKENYLITRPQFDLSYNNATGIPNWVSWHIDKTWITGSAKRQNKFIADPVLTSSSGFNVVKNKHYACSDFAQGHLCPSADRITSTQADNDITFAMTNMVPQSPKSNSTMWSYFEAYLRKLVSKDNQEVYIISGPAGVGGENGNGEVKNKLDPKYTDGLNIEVPQYLWKIAVVLPDGNDDLNRINADTRVICVLTPNTQSANTKKWYDYRISVNELERVVPAGFDFLNAIPNPAVKSALKSKIDTVTLRKSHGEHVYCTPPTPFTAPSSTLLGAKRGPSQPHGQETAITVAPNPFQSDFTVRYTLQEADRVTVYLRDLQGRELRQYLQEQPQTKGSQQFLAPVKGLPPGLYLLEVRGQKHTFPTQRLLKSE